MSLRIAAVLASVATLLSALDAPARASTAQSSTIHRISHPIRTLHVHGYGYPHRYWYRLTQWKVSDVHACARHSYGRPMKRYFHRDPCRDDTRYLYTLKLHGRRAVLEIESVVTGVLPGDLNGAKSSGEFIHLEESANTDSVNDLLREGWRIPRAGPGIPRHEVFRIHAEDSGVVVFDAWYRHGGTDENDHALVELESQLFLTRAARARGI